MLKKILEKYKPEKLNKLYIFMAAAGVLLLILTSSFSAEKAPKEDTAAKTDINEYKNQTEKELSEIINSIDGVSSAKVMITFGDNGKTEYLNEEKISMQNGESSVNQDRESSAAFMRENGDETPVVVRELLPEIRGVAVVASGNSNKELELKILNSVKGALGIGANRINIVINERNE